ncbi:uncharacterized protein B0H18DRAFT_1049647 [Fomitopsis serialis]|uniref:uncharacterized protein n=1 Tax=Fomitopsis serialis TaxID=139415 RepID=UPI002008B0ED|nr:uncharacterized protein B0H18DRAFT_1049647 [Neoantrodia serialis]KAH9913280.1 hypothetical protein B0H18DRAFT_1049647 [Neoantrodia serialis]
MDDSQTAFIAQYPGYNFDLDMMKVSIRVGLLVILFALERSWAVFRARERDPGPVYGWTQTAGWLLHSTDAHCEWSPSVHGQHKLALIAASSYLRLSAAKVTSVSSSGCAVRLWLPMFCSTDVHSKRVVYSAGDRFPSRVGSTGFAIWVSDRKPDAQTVLVQRGALPSRR